MMLGSASSGSQFGAVTAIENNHDNTRLLVGYESGTVVRWDLTQGMVVVFICVCVFGRLEDSDGVAPHPCSLESVGSYLCQVMLTTVNCAQPRCLVQQ